MKVVINACFGGFSLSRTAIARLAELQGRPCFFFSADIGTGAYAPVSDSDKDPFCLFAFDIPNPNDVLVGRDDWMDRTTEERIAANKLHESHAIESRPEKRSDPMLVQVVEELGKAANGRCADLRIVEIPDDVAWEIDEYDGNETIHEKHRSWS